VLPPDERRSVVGHRLVISNVNRNDAGVLQCTAQNVHGSILANAILTVSGTTCCTTQIYNKSTANQSNGVWSISSGVAWVMGARGELQFPPPNSWDGARDSWCPLSPHFCCPFLIAPGVVRPLSLATPLLMPLTHAHETFTRNLHVWHAFLRKFFFLYKFFLPNRTQMYSEQVCAHFCARICTNLRQNLTQENLCKVCCTGFFNKFFWAVALLLSSSVYFLYGASSQAVPAVMTWHRLEAHLFGYSSSVFEGPSSSKSQGPFDIGHSVSL